MTDLEVYLRARYPLLCLLTGEEERAIATLRQLAEDLGRDVTVWSCTAGLGGDPEARDPLVALERIRQAGGRTIYVLCDLQPFFGNAAVVRKLRELGQHVKATGKAVVLVAAQVKLPPELVPDVTLVDMAVPDDATIRQLIDRAAEMAGRPVVLDRLERERLAAAARGLTAGEIANALARALVMHRGLDVRAIAVMGDEKRHVVRKTGVLEYIEAGADKAMAAVGGLEQLKGWLRGRAQAFGQRARDFGLPAPRGLLLVGVQGCGKSLVAQAVAREWDLPLVRLDVGRLMSGLVGASEENTRAALRMAEGLAPVVLWIDELEKAFAGHNGAGDGGTSARVLGTFLTWLQEKQAPVFVIATANQLDRLPPELLRKGRFDETFFVDLPGAREREAILRIHLEHRRRHAPDHDVARLAALAEGMSGAELAQAVVDALYMAFEGGRPLTDEDLAAAIGATTPLSRSMAPAIAALREWAGRFARPASDPIEAGPEVAWAIEAAV